MPRLALIALSMLAVSACATTGPQAGSAVEFAGAEPDKVLATERDFARMITEDGQWTAFRKYVGDDAVMFTPDPVDARDWLEGREIPPTGFRREPYEMWSSCDGSLAVVRGIWDRREGEFGTFYTVWQRQLDGEYRWVVDHGDRLFERPEPPAQVGQAIADCVRDDDRPDARVARQTGIFNKVWRSQDRTLNVAVSHGDGRRTLGVTIWRDHDDRLVVEDHIELRGP